MLIYNLPGGFRADAPKAGTKQAVEKPLTLNGTGIVRYTLTDDQYARWDAETDVDARAAILAEGLRFEVTGKRVQIPTAGLAFFVSRCRAKVDAAYAAAVEAHSALVAELPKGADRPDAPAAPTAADYKTYAKNMIHAGEFVSDSATADDTESVIDALFD